MHATRLVGLIAGYSDGFVIADLVLGVAFGFLGYFASERYRRANGVSPWRWPSAVWAVLFFVSLLLGGILFLIARSTTRPKAGSSPWTGGPPPGAERGVGGRGRDGRDGWDAPPPPGWGPPASGGWDAPAPGGWGAVPPVPPGPPPPGGWDAPPPPGTTFPAFGPPGSTQPASDPTLVSPSTSGPPPPPPPRSWLPDPGGRHELRYWDGSRFTEHVADGGKISVDPL